jgi:hypothetical protein
MHPSDLVTTSRQTLRPQPSCRFRSTPDTNYAAYRDLPLADLACAALPLPQVARETAWDNARRALHQRQLAIDCLAASLRETNLNSRTAEGPPPEAMRLRRILDFKFVSRLAPPSNL